MAGEGDERLWGPGVLDMKAGVAMALAAVGCWRKRLADPEAGDVAAEQR